MSASKKLLQAAAGNAVGGNKWLSISPNETNIDDMPQLQASTSDSDGNIYFAGYTGTYIQQGNGYPQRVNGSTTSTNSPFILKMDASGTILWSKVYREPSTENLGNAYGANGIAVNDSGRIMVTLDGTNPNRPGVMLVDASDGSFLDCMRFDLSNYGISFRKIATDGTDFVAVGAYIDSPTDSKYRGIVMGFVGGTATTITMQPSGYTYGVEDAATPTSNTDYDDIIWDSTNSTYSVVGYGGGSYPKAVCRASTTGSTSSRAYFTGGISYTFGVKHITDGTYYYYMKGRTILKTPYNSNISTMYTQTPTWTKTFNNITTANNQGLVLSTNGDYLYVSFRGYGIIKLNTSDGSIVSQKTFATLSAPEPNSGDYSFGAGDIVCANDNLYIIHSDVIGPGLMSTGVIIIPEDDFDDYEFRLDYGYALLDPDTGYEASVSTDSYTATYSTAGSIQFYSVTTINPTDVTDFNSAYTVTDRENKPGSLIIQGLGRQGISGTTGTYYLSINSRAGGIHPKAGDILIYFNASAGVTVNLAMPTTTTGFTTISSTYGYTAGPPAHAIGYQDLTGTLSSNYLLNFSGANADQSYNVYALLVRGVSVPTNFSVVQNNFVSNTLFITPNAVTAPNAGFILTLVAAGGSSFNSGYYVYTDSNLTPDHFSSTGQNDTYDTESAIGIQYVNSASTVTLPEYQPKTNVTSNSGVRAVSIFLDTE